ncbi:MAG: nitrophenyl compound nitroreductase subunit ArsF family protein [Candidatus Diapherotrites archaeon]|nr:nitrophenyl compound nitroreductase subunit ArsF family protein [Candidatus Diapherotrites archaeon]
MNKKILALVFVAFLVFSGCTQPAGTQPPTSDANLAGGENCIDSNAKTCLATPKPTEIQSPTPEKTPEDKNVRVEVYHFHATRQCNSCITLGKFAEKTVNEFFSEELVFGKIKFGHVNIELPENNELVSRYEPLGSSLWIGTYIDGEFHKEEDVSVWYKLGNEFEFKTYLKGVLEKRLSGELG